MGVIMKYLSSGVLLSLVLFLCAYSISGEYCEFQKKKAAITQGEYSVEKYVEVQNPKYFTGVWKSTNAKNYFSIDISNKTAVKHYKSAKINEKIEEMIPINNGYCLLIRYPNPVLNKKPKWEYTIVVIKKLESDKLLMIEAPDLVTIFKRDE